MHERWDDPAVNRRVVKALLILAPVMFVASYVIALAQGAPRNAALVISVLALAMALGTAAAIHWLKSQALIAFGAAALLVSLLAALLKS